MSLFLYASLVSAVLLTWLGTVRWVTRSPDLQARHGATLGWLGTVLGTSCGLLGVGFGLWMAA